MAKETKSLGQKDKLDRFYTKEETVNKCLSLIDTSKYDLIIEPSAGAGAFSNKLECKAYDIEPADNKIIKANWFEIDKSEFKGRILVIGNPPFGQQNSLALEFFNSCGFADTIAFILPRSFKKVSIQNRMNLDFSLEKEIDLPDNSFYLNNKSYNVPCIFQIWIKTKTPRKKKRMRITTDLFEFTDKTKADFRIQRVGGNAGKASFDLNYSSNSNYFIKNTSSLSNEDFIKIINSLHFPSVDWTVGPKSLSKGELIEVLEEYINQNNVDS